MSWVVFFYLAINLFLLGLGIGIGFLLHWILPAVDLGVGILIGVVTTIASVNLYLRFHGITEQIEDETLLQEIMSKRSFHVIESKPGKRSQKRKAPGSQLPRS
jgi:hypothetical protein